MIATKSGVPGYSMEFLRADTLFRDESYQRALEPRRVNRISDGFDWSRFRPINVGRRDDGTLWIIDGQHRWAAARKALGDDVEIPCWVKLGTTPDQEAGSFLDINNEQKAVKPGARVRAGVACGKDMEVEMAAVLDEFSIYKDYDGKGGPFSDYNMSSWSGPIKIYRDGGGAALRRAIDFTVGMWGFGKEALCEYSLVGSHLFLKSYGGARFTDFDAVRSISRYTFEDVKVFAFMSGAKKSSKKQKAASARDRNASWAEGLRIAYNKTASPTDRI